MALTSDELSSVNDATILSAFAAADNDNRNSAISVHSAVV